MPCQSVASIAAVAALAALPAAGQVVTECAQSWVASPAHIAEPWEANTRTFANGAIRLAVLDTLGEPACCAVHLLVLSPNARAELSPHVECRVISATDGLGWADMDLREVDASHDPARGLLVDVPIWTYVDGLNDLPGRLRVRINQATGAVTVE